MQQLLKGYKMKEYVKIDKNEGIATIEFFHPQSNSLPANILHKIAVSINETDYDEDIKVIILKSKCGILQC